MGAADGTRRPAILPRLAAPSDIALRAQGGPELAALLWPAPAGAAGVLVVHGLDSRKENHADFGGPGGGGRHGGAGARPAGPRASGGALDEGLADDVLAGLGELAARIDARVRAVVAICPAPPERLAARLGEDRPRRLWPEPPARPDGVARGYWATERMASPGRAPDIPALMSGPSFLRGGAV